MRKLRALSAAFTFLLGASLAPVALASQVNQEVCQMACCVSEGHCCCKPAKPAVKGQKRDRGETQFVNVELSKPCSEDCAASRAAANLFPRAFVQPANSQFKVTGAAAIHAPPAFRHCATVDLVSASPRAPPSCFRNFPA
jgi:hypothetical protein